MTESEMEFTMQSDIIKYIGPSSGGLLHNKLYTIRERKNNVLALHMPKGQRISVWVEDHDLWEMEEAKGAAEAKKRRVNALTEDFYSYLDLDYLVDDLNGYAKSVEDLMKDFPLDAKMKLLGKLSKDELDLLDFFHSICKNKLTTERLVKMFKKKEKL